MFLLAASESLIPTASALKSITDWLSYDIVCVHVPFMTDWLTLVQTQFKYYNYYVFTVAIAVSCPGERIVQFFPHLLAFVLFGPFHHKWTEIKEGWHKWLSCLGFRTHSLLSLNTCTVVSPCIYHYSLERETFPIKAKITMCLSTKTDIIRQFISLAKLK